MKIRSALGVCLFLLFGPVGLGEPASETEQLIAILDEKPDVSTVSEAIVYETDEQKRVEYIKQKNLERERQWIATQDAIVQLAAMGDMAVDPIVRKLKSRDYSMEFLEPALQVLQKINTPKSQQVLLSIALGKDGFESPRNRVIKYYVRNLQDKSKATIFLKSDNDSLIRYVLDGLCGASLDDALFSCIETLMQTNQGSSSSCFSMKDKTARVLAADPNMALADRK